MRAMTLDLSNDDKEQSPQNILGHDKHSMAPSSVEHSRQWPALQRCGLKQNHTHQLEHKISVRANKLKPIGANLSTMDRVPQEKLE